MKMRKYCKLPAILLALILLTVSLGACAKDKTEGSSQPEHKPGGASGQARGRYTERSVTLPPELAEQSIQHIFAADNVLHLLSMKELDDGIRLQEWVCQDGTFTEVTQDWLAGLKLPATDWIEARLAQNSAGEQFLYAGYAQETDSGFAFIGHLWKGTAEGAADITPEKWTVPNDAELGGYEMIQDLPPLTTIPWRYSPFPAWISCPPRTAACWQASPPPLIMRATLPQTAKMFTSVPLTLTAA